MTRIGLKLGTASLALGLSLAVPQTVGLASADTPDSADSSGPASPHVSRGTPPPPRQSAAAQTSAAAPAGPVAGSAATRAGSPAASGNSSAATGPRPASSVKPVSDIPTIVVTPPAAAAQQLQRRVGIVDPGIVSSPAAATALPGARSSGSAIPGAAVSVTAPAALATVKATSPAASAPVMHQITAGVVQFAQFLDSLANRISGLPVSPVRELMSGALLLVRRTLLPRIPTMPVVTVGDTLVSAGSAENPQTAVFTVTLQSAYTVPVTVRYATVDGTAIGGTDYAPVSGEFVFAPGQTTREVSVPVIADGAAQQSVSFGLNVLPAAGPSWLNHTVLATGTARIANLATAAPPITFPELDSSTSTLAVRVNPTQQTADAIKVDAGTTFTLTLPDAATAFTVLANKPGLVDITEAGNQLTLTAKTPGFLGLSVKSDTGTAARYVGLYIADPVTHLVPDTVTGYTPVGTITDGAATGDAYLENFNFRKGVAPIDYLYIYDQGGADYTDGNLRALLTQAAHYGMVPVVVYYNIQAVNTAAGRTGITEGPNAAFQAINNFNYSGSGQTDPNMFTGYMKRYYTKLATDFTTMNKVGIPVQVVVEPDFLGYMAANDPTFDTSSMKQKPVPDTGDRTKNYVDVTSMYDAGLLVKDPDPSKNYANDVAGFVQAINYYTGKNMQNLRLGWKTNIWAVKEQQNWSLGILHMTDATPKGKDEYTPLRYPWQGPWTGPANTYLDGRKYIADETSKLGAFLQKAGVTSWSGSPSRAPFLAIDKYGVDGAYTYDPAMLDDTSQTAAFGNLYGFVNGAYINVAKMSDADSQKYFGLNTADFKAFYESHCPAGQCSFPKTDPAVAAVWTAMQKAAIADPNMAAWFFNADQWNNYLLLVNTLSTALGGTKVMLWQIPQGHINGSTDLPNTDLSNTVGNFEDSATSYFFGDTFTASTDGRLTHFGLTNQAKDPGVTVSGNSVTWGQHMTLAGDSGALSVLFGAGLGISTRGSVTPVGGANDNNFWYDKASGYLSSVTSP